MTSTTFFFIFIPLLAIILLAVNLIFAPHNPYQEKDSVFECGFHSFLGQNRTQFSISFFIFALLFLLFDLEILLVYPYVVSAHTNGIYGLVIMLIFFLALTLGFAFELGKNALKIDSRQMISLNNKSNSKTLLVSAFTNVNKIIKDTEKVSSKWLLSRDLNNALPLVIKGKGNYLYTEDGQKMFDASGGAAVSCIGHGNKKVTKEIIKELGKGFPYISSTIFSNSPSQELSALLIKGTNYLMGRAHISNSGSEAMEGAIKIASQYNYELNKLNTRTKIISREGSYHGATLSTLSISRHISRIAPYKGLLKNNVHQISSCNAYRQLQVGQSYADFVLIKSNELEAKILELGPDNVLAFVFEPVVGAATGCVPFVPGYLKAMRDVCHKYGVIIIFDEIMCGMGRTGYTHAWQAEGISPDIQTIGKALAGGYQPIAATLVSTKIADVLKNGSGKLVHGQTYHAMPIVAAAGLAVQNYVIKNNLIENVRLQSTRLDKGLRANLENHPNVGDIRVSGLFIGIEFVFDKLTKIPFHSSVGVTDKFMAMINSAPYNMTVYPGYGTVDGVHGNHIILAPAFNIKDKDTDHIIEVVSAVTHKLFELDTIRKGFSSAPTGEESNTNKS